MEQGKTQCMMTVTTAGGTTMDNDHKSLDYEATFGGRVGNEEKERNWSEKKEGVN